MLELPACFYALAQYNQFVIWQAIPSKTKPGKFEKITINPATLFPHNAHDPSIWYDAASAIAIAANLGDTFSIGFVFTANDPFWFFDLDNCTTPDNQWTPETLAFIAHFTGAAVEVSISGKGLHIIGSGAASLPEHGTNNKHIGHQFYSHKRFVALTGNQTSGDAAFDASHLLPDFAAYYFPPTTATISAEWTTEPDPKSRPLKTDKALISKMLSSNSAHTVFGKKISVADLWNANPETLASVYPPFNETDPFDRSSADQALCNHLAFWTGKDCDRIERLMSQSGLMRDKWDKRPKYRTATILKAISGCQDVYGSQKAEQEEAQTVWQPDQQITNTAITANGGSQIVTYEERPQYFAGHFFLTRSSKVFCPDGVMRNQTEYNAMYSIAEFAEPFGGKPVTEAWKAYVTATDVTRMSVYDTAYRPEYGFGVTFTDCEREYVNEYINRDGKRVVGDASPFLNHVKIMLPNGRDAEILLSWMAALVQYPGVKFKWSPFLQGAEGNGKSLITRLLRYCIGVDHFEDVDPEEFCSSGGKFNAYVKNKRLAALEEIKTGSRNQAEAALKRFIGNDYQSVRAMQTDQITLRTCINWILNSNHKDAIHVGDVTRRFAILFCAQQELDDLIQYDMQRGGKYFRELFKWLDGGGWGIAANWLDTYAIPVEFNPAGDADKAPQTTSFLEAISESKSAPHQAVAELLSSGRPGTLNSWVSIQAIRSILQSDYGIRSPSGKMLAKYLKAEGYIKHPALINQGRLTRTVMQEGGQRSVIYVKSGSVQAGLTDAADVTEKYLNAQGYLGLPAAQQSTGVQPL